MGVGMTAVFGFLTLMVATMHASAAFFERYGAYFEEPVPPRKAAAPGPAPEIAVILAALEAHRKGG
ncbi:MAG: OadG family protein [Alphaproteobacteria bacterium]|nr:OadG family protein [Alphaproteobacteria bacterium]